MAGLTVVRSWHTRDFLFVILAFLFVNVCVGQLIDPNNVQYSELNEAVFGYRSHPPMMPNQNMPPPPASHSEVNLIDPFNRMPFNAHELAPYEQPLNTNLELVIAPQYRSNLGGDPFNRMSFNAHELAPYELPLNTNLELVSAPQYRSNPNGALAMPFYEEFLNDNLQPEYRSHHVEALPFYEETLNDNLQLERLPEYRSHPVGDHTVLASPVSTFSGSMHPLYVPQEANYRSRHYYYYPISPFIRGRYGNPYAISPFIRGRYGKPYVHTILQNFDSKLPIHPGDPEDNSADMNDNGLLQYFY